MRRALSIGLPILCLACGGSGSPTEPTPVAQVAGVWSYRVTLSGVSGGECVGAALQSLVGSTTTGTIQISQSGGSLTATTTNDDDGSNCTYTGTAGSNSFALNGNSCSIGVITGLMCPNGAARDIRIQTLGINATVSGSGANGTSAETWNVFVAGTASGVGPMTFNGNFTATRR
jgi:hypothetical protein